MCGHWPYSVAHCEAIPVDVETLQCMTSLAASYGMVWYSLSPTGFQIRSHEEIASEV